MVEAPSRSAAGGSRRMRAEQTQAALKRAALVVFGRTGYLNAKITDITREAGRAAGSFYSHFDGKEALLEALLVDVFAQADVQVAQDGHSDDFSDPAAVRWHVATYWGFLRRNRTLMLSLRQAATVDERFARRLRELSREDLSHLAQHLEVARSRGVVLPGEPDLVASAMAGLLWEFAERSLAATADQGGPAVPDEVAIDLLTEFLVRAIGLRTP